MVMANPVTMKTMAMVASGGRREAEKRDSNLNCFRNTFIWQLCAIPFIIHGWQKIKPRRFSAALTIIFTLSSLFVCLDILNTTRVHVMCPEHHLISVRAYLGEMRIVHIRIKPLFFSLSVTSLDRGGKCSLLSALVRSSRETAQIPGRRRRFRELCTETDRARDLGRTLLLLEASCGGGGGGVS